MNSKNKTALRRLIAVFVVALSALLLSGCIGIGGNFAHRDMNLPYDKGNATTTEVIRKVNLDGTTSIETKEVTQTAMAVNKDITIEQLRRSRDAYVGRTGGYHPGGIGIASSSSGGGGIYSSGGSGMVSGSGGGSSTVNTGGANINVQNGTVDAWQRASGGTGAMGGGTFTVGGQGGQNGTVDAWQRASGGTGSLGGSTFIVGGQSGQNGTVNAWQNASQGTGAVGGGTTTMQGQTGTNASVDAWQRASGGTGAAAGYTFP